MTYVDFTKAFYTVSQNKLIVKLVALGINENLLSWMKNFATNRNYQTIHVVGTFLSDNQWSHSRQCSRPLIAVLDFYRAACNADAV